MRGLRIGGNYTYLQRHLDFAAAAAGLPAGANAAVTPAARAAIAASDVEGTPRNEAFIYLAWNPWRSLTLTPSVELASDRSSLVTSCASTLVAGMEQRTLPTAAATSLQARPCCPTTTGSALTRS
jgi:iron complex outermembrane receptor protein